MATDPFDTLLERYQNCEATPEEIVGLEKLLRADPNNRRRFVESILLAVQLRKACSGILPLSPQTLRPLRWFRGVGVWVAAAAAVVLAVGAFLIFPPGKKKGSDPEVVASQVRKVVGAAPESIDLPDSSHVDLDPFSEAVIHSRSVDTRQVIELTSGGGNFQVAHGGGQFRVETPVGTVTALGTKFSVKLQTRGKGKSGAKAKQTLVVAVTEGSVRVDAGGKSYVLADSKTRVFGDDGEQNNRDDGDQNNGKKNDRNDGGKGNQQNGENGEQNKDEGNR